MSIQFNVSSPVDAHVTEALDDWQSAQNSKTQKLIDRLGIFEPKARQEMEKLFQDRLFSLEKECLSRIKARPDLELQTKEFQENENSILKAFKARDIAEIDKILKPYKELKVVPPFLKGQDWWPTIESTIFHSDSERAILIKFLECGAQIPHENRKEFIRFLCAGPINKELVELLISAGFDCNEDARPAFEANSYEDGSKLENRRNLLFYGIGKYKMFPGSYQKDPSQWDEACIIRAEALWEMSRAQSHKQSLDFKNLTLPQRRELSERCHAIYNYLHPKNPEDPIYLQDKARHDDLALACSEGDVEKAEKLLASASFHLNLPEKSDTRNLLQQACDKNNLALAELLLQSGINPNSFSGELPPIFRFWTDNSSPMLNLLVKYGADCNAERFNEIPWVLSMQFSEALEETNEDQRIFDFFGVFICQGLDINKKCSECFFTSRSSGSFPANLWDNCRKFVKDEVAFKMFLIFHGYNVQDCDVSELESELLEALKIRHQHMIKPHLETIDALKRMSLPLVGIISDYAVDGFAPDMTPEERLTLAEQCYATEQELAAKQKSLAPTSVSEQPAS